MISPTAQLQAALEATRDALDAGALTRLRASRRVARHCRAALRRYPYDAELGLAVNHMSNRGFIPPHPAALPPGDDATLWIILTGRVSDELRHLAATYVTWPDPAQETEEAARMLALFLLIPEERERTEALIEALAPHVSPEATALARFRLTAHTIADEDADDSEHWGRLLEPLRALGESGEAALGRACCIAASAIIGSASHHGAEWMQPVLGGQLILNVNLALRRRPALREELGPAMEWIEESRRLSTGTHSSLVEVLEGLEIADEQGDFETGTAQLDAAIAMSADRADITQALAARAAVLGDAVLAARAVALGAAVPPFTLRLEVARPMETMTPTVMLNWSNTLSALASPETLPERTDELLFLEEAGSRRRAAQGWIARGDTQALLQAARLADALTDDERASLTAAVRACLPEDELNLAPEDEALAHALFSKLSNSVERTLWGLRLGAIATSEPAQEATPEAYSSDAKAAPDDPHSVKNRLAAAEDLLDADNLEAGGAILSALLRHDEAVTIHSELVALTTRALRSESPPSVLLSGASRCVLSLDAPGPSLLKALIGDAMAAYALHDVLHSGALDRRRTEAQRVWLLEAWLGIWAATVTPPDPTGLQALMHIDPILLPLAANRLAQSPDPVAESAAFMTRYPPLETTAAEYGQALLDRMVPAPHGT
jgi:hypothetical protein